MLCGDSQGMVFISLSENKVDKRFGQLVFQQDDFPSENKNW